MKSGNSRAFAALFIALSLPACSSLDLKGSGERWRDSQRRAECYKQYRKLCPEIKEPGDID